MHFSTSNQKTRNQTFVKCESTFSDCNDYEKEVKRNKESIKQKLDANRMTFKSINDRLKNKNNDSDKSFDEVLKNDTSYEFQTSFANVKSSDKKADLSTDDLVCAGELNENTQTE